MSDHVHMETNGDLTGPALKVGDADLAEQCDALRARGDELTRRMDAAEREAASNDKDEDAGSHFAINVKGEGVEHNLELDAEDTEGALKLAAKPGSWLPGEAKPKKQG